MFMYALTSVIIALVCMDVDPMVDANTLQSLANAKFQLSHDFKLQSG